MFGLSSSGLEMAEPQVQNSALIGVIKLEPMDKAAYDTQVKNVEEFILESGLSPGVAKTLIDDVKVKKMGHLELIVDRKVNLTQYFKPLQAAEVIDRLAVHWSLGSRGSNKHKDAADVLKSQGFHQLHADSPPNLPLYSVSNCEMYLPVYMSVTIKSLRQINEMLSTVDISMTLMIRILLGGMDDSVRAMIIEGLALRVNDKAQDMGRLRAAYLRGVSPPSWCSLLSSPHPPLVSSSLLQLPHLYGTCSLVETPRGHCSLANLRFRLLVLAPLLCLDGVWDLWQRRCMATVWRQRTLSYPMGGSITSWSRIQGPLERAGVTLTHCSPTVLTSARGEICRNTASNIPCPPSSTSARDTGLTHGSSTSAECPW